MNREEIVKELNIQYSKFIDYLRSLNTDEFEFRYQDKWSAKEQLEHIIMCVQPLVQVYGMPKIVIEETFGSTERLNKSYQELLDEYLRKLYEGGKAPSTYVPKNESQEHTNDLIGALNSLIQKLNLNINTFTENELETLLLPHPLLGKITLKEMLYNAIYHVQHHQYQIIDNLKEDNQQSKG